MSTNISRRDKIGGLPTRLPRAPARTFELLMDEYNLCLVDPEAPDWRVLIGLLGMLNKRLYRRAEPWRVRVRVGRGDELWKAGELPEQDGDRVLMVLSAYRKSRMARDWSGVLDCLERLNRLDDPRNKLRALPGETGRAG